MGGNTSGAMNDDARLIVRGMVFDGETELPGYLMRIRARIREQTGHAPYLGEIMTEVRRALEETA